MRAITVQQPWAEAMFWDVHPKDVENRTRNIAGDFRGTFAIHAGQRFSVAGGRDRRILAHPAYADADLVFGAVIGVIDLTGVHHTTGSHPCCGSPWADLQCNHLELARPRRLTTPVECFGKLGLWTLPADVSREIRRQLLGTVSSG